MMVERLGGKSKEGEGTGLSSFVVVVIILWPNHQPLLSSYHHHYHPPAPHCHVLSLCHCALSPTPIVTASLCAIVVQVTSALLLLALVVHCTLLLHCCV